MASGGTNVDMEVIDLEPTSTEEAVLTAVKDALLTAGKSDAAVEAAIHCVTITSMWRLKNGQQVAKVSVPRAAKPTGVTRVRVGWTSCRFRIRRPDAVRCFKCHGFGHSQGRCTGHDMKVRLGPHRPGSAACRARCAAEPWRTVNHLRNN